VEGDHVTFHLFLCMSGNLLVSSLLEETWPFIAACSCTFAIVITLSDSVVYSCRFKQCWFSLMPAIFL